MPERARFGSQHALSMIHSVASWSLLSFSSKACKAILLSNPMARSCSSTSGSAFPSPEPALCLRFDAPVRCFFAPPFLLPLLPAAPSLIPPDLRRVFLLAWLFTGSASTSAARVSAAGSFSFSSSPSADRGETVSAAAGLETLGDREASCIFSSLANPSAPGVRCSAFRFTRSFFRMPTRAALSRPARSPTVPPRFPSSLLFASSSLCLSSAAFASCTCSSEMPYFSFASFCHLARSSLFGLGPELMSRPPFLSPSFSALSARILSISTRKPV
mmetsp:Transcript_35203/g.76359  ORF Transcript_35203/g.76359 Transcript_35203/m.76359 type:complete len:273 (+) Transcript_35203:1745-2563(+)